MDNKTILAPYFCPSEQKQTHTCTLTHTKGNCIDCSSSPSLVVFTGASFTVLILLVPQLACCPRTRCIFRFVKSVKMPVMNISTASSVFNVLFDQPKRNLVKICHYRNRGSDETGHFHLNTIPYNKHVLFGYAVNFLLTSFLCMSVYAM